MGSSLNLETLLNFLSKELDILGVKFVAGDVKESGAEPILSQVVNCFIAFIQTFKEKALQRNSAHDSLLKLQSDSKAAQVSYRVLQSDMKKLEKENVDLKNSLQKWRAKESELLKSLEDKKKEVAKLNNLYQVIKVHYENDMRKQEEKEDQYKRLLSKYCDVSGKTSSPLPSAPATVMENLNKKHLEYLERNIQDLLTESSCLRQYVFKYLHFLEEALKKPLRIPEHFLYFPYTMLQQQLEKVSKEIESELDCRQSTGVT